MHMLQRKILIQDIANDNVCKLSTLEIYQLDEMKGLEKTPQPVNIILPSESLFNRAVFNADYDFEGTKKNCDWVLEAIDYIF